ncbi:MAG: hypothetical protein L0Y44_07305, partial [Phycisphaerales bacterium]|nr:hypothetical protein [Phycisphaerales bacterium]
LPTHPAPPPEVLRAYAFELLSKEGKVVAQLFTAEDGSGNLRLRSGDGMVRVKLGATADGTAMHLFDAQAEPAVSLITDEKLGTSVTLAQKGKQKRVIEP